MDVLEMMEPGPSSIINEFKDAVVKMLENTNQ